MRVRTTALEAYANQNVPFAKVVEAVRPPRQTSHHPLFQVMFSFLSKPARDLAFHDARLGPPEPLRGTPDFDLFLTMFSQVSTLHGVLGYNTDLFDRTTAERLIDALGVVLEQAARQPALRLADFQLPELITAAETPQAEQTIAIAANFTAEPVEAALGFWMRELDLSATVAFAPYNQVFQQLLDPSSLLSSNQRGLNVMLVRLEGWLQADRTSNGNENGVAGDGLAHQVQELVRATQASAQRNAVPLLLCLCPASPATQADDRQAGLLAGAEQSIADELSGLGNVHVVTPAQLAAVYPVARYAIDQIDLLKIDVEKSEVDVLNGIAAADWDKIRQIVIEVHAGLLEPVTDILTAHGFESVVEQEAAVQDTDFYYVLYAVRPYSGPRLSADTRIQLPALDEPFLSAEQLGLFIRQELPQDMTHAPVAFVILEALPHTADGAVDIQALPPAEPSAVEGGSYVAPRTPTEEHLAAIWAEMLGYEQVSVRDDFFALGGHSLLATQILARVRDELEIDLPMRVLFTDTFTVEELAKAIEQYRIEQADVEADEIALLLQELEGLSDEEVRERLAGENIV